MEVELMTFDALRKWKKHTFEKLGKVVLANAKGYHFKVAEYKLSLARLAAALEVKLQRIQDPDKREDLAIMLDHVQILRQHVEKDFPGVEQMLSQRLASQGVTIPEFREAVSQRLSQRLSPQGMLSQRLSPQGSIFVPELQRTLSQGNILVPEQGALSQASILVPEQAAFSQRLSQQVNTLM